MKHEFRFPIPAKTLRCELPDGSLPVKQDRSWVDPATEREPTLNRRQRRAEAAIGRREGRRVARILQKQMTREVEARKAKQDAADSLVPVPAVDPSSEG